MSIYMYAVATASYEYGNKICALRMPSMALAKYIECSFAAALQFVFLRACENNKKCVVASIVSQTFAIYNCSLLLCYL